MKTNIKEMSQITGFSPATISNALNHKKGVNKETAAEVIRVAKEMGSVAARRMAELIERDPDAIKYAQLTRKRLEELGVVFVDITDINECGWVEHDPMEIIENTILVYKSHCYRQYVIRMQSMG